MTSLDLQFNRNHNGMHVEQNSDGHNQNRIHPVRYSLSGSDTRRPSKATFTDLSHYDDASYDPVSTASCRLFGFFGPYVTLKKKHKIALITSITTILVLGIGALLGLIYIAQLVSFVINKSSFDVQLSRLSDIKSDSFNLAFSSNIYRTGPVVATLSSSVMYLVNEKGDALGRFLVPPQTLDGSWGSTPSMALNANFEILDEDQFSFFMIRVMNEKIVPWRLISEFNVSVNLFPERVFPIYLDKTIYIRGLNALSEQKIIFFDLPENTESGIAVNVKTRLINSSPIAMSAGKAQFKMYYHEVLIGRIALSSMELSPGENEWTLSGNLTQLSAQEMATVNDFFNDFIKGKDSYVRVVGEYLYPSSNSSVSIPWLQNAFGNLIMTLNMPGIKDYKPITSIDIISMFIDFTSPLSTSSNEFPITANIQATYSLPFGFPVKVLSLSQNIRIIESKSKALLATTVFPQTEVLCDLSKKQVNGNGIGVMNIPDSSVTSMVAFLTSVITDEQFSMTLEGEANSVMSSNQGVMTLKNLSITQQLNMKGMNSLKNPAPTIKAIRVLKANPTDGIFKEIDLELVNPSPVGSNLGRVEFNLFYNNTFIGISVIGSLALLPGVNRVKAHGLLTLPPHTPLMEEFLSLYVRGSSIPIEMRGSDSSSLIPILIKPLSSIITSTTIRGIDIPLVEYCKLSRSFSGDLFVKFRVVNPMDIPVTITGLSGYSVYFGEKATSFDISALINTIEFPVMKNPTIIPPRSSIMINEWIPMQQKASFTLEKKIALEITKRLCFFTSTKGYIHLLLDEYPVALYYEQRDVKVYFALF